MVRPNVTKYPTMATYAIAMETYADYLEERVEGLDKASDDASWALEEARQAERDAFGNEWK